jgi:hypothetical protein
MRRSILPQHINLNDFQRLRLHAQSPQDQRSPVQRPAILRRRVFMRFQHHHRAPDLQVLGMAVGG